MRELAAFLTIAGISILVLVAAPESPSPFPFKTATPPKTDAERLQELDQRIDNQERILRSLKLKRHEVQTALGNVAQCHADLATQADHLSIVRSKFALAVDKKQKAIEYAGATNNDSSHDVAVKRINALYRGRAYHDRDVAQSILRESHQTFGAVTRLQADLRTSEARKKHRELELAAAESRLQQFFLDKSVNLSDPEAVIGEIGHNISETEIAIARIRQEQEPIALRETIRRDRERRELAHERQRQYTAQTTEATSRRHQNTSTRVEPKTSNQNHDYRPPVGHHEVSGHFRKNGTYVQPYRRTNPDSSFSNNWSSYGNVNPITGRKGYAKPPK